MRGVSCGKAGRAWRSDLVIGASLLAVWLIVGSQDEKLSSNGHDDTRQKDFAHCRFLKSSKTDSTNPLMSN
jgi:hypothetical protein